MLDNDNIITSVLKAVEKITTDEKDYRKCSLMVFCFAQPQHTEQTNICYKLTEEIVVYLPRYITCGRKIHRRRFT